jgi:hypothetical protein
LLIFSFISFSFLLLLGVGLLKCHKNGHYILLFLVFLLFLLLKKM